MMGHLESFYFFDMRVGERGVEYNRPARKELEQVAIAIGYLGAIHLRITAYPPKPSTELLAERAMREQFDDIVPF
ncbi:hypothetical protein [Pseudomonas sp. MWU12-2323]|uniref:hypothetical protein n=1 Tax=Pseudomonas sp. MWU12-2323 TaxID=2651296 RepID=UPI00128E192B|nr:hypothetical protein [Pseudomonas sp. MWU12-2323]MPQ69435.1 hypothetical protein [Pseudomonas sp. MWU12-2323]